MRIFTTVGFDYTSKLSINEGFIVLSEHKRENNKQIAYATIQLTPLQATSLAYELLKYAEGRC